MLETYEKRSAEFQAEIEAEEAKSLQASNRRTLVFGAAAAAFLAAGYAPIPAALATALYAVGPILLIVFFGLVIAHRRISEAIERATHLKQLNLDACARLDRRWDDFPVPPTPVEFKDHPTARDLDLFGQASLFQLLNTAITPIGRERLADWISNPSDPEVAAARQPAVHELSPQLDWRQQLHFAGHHLKERDQSANTMPVRQDDAPWIGQMPTLRLAARLLPVAFFGLLLAQFGGLMSVPWWLVPLIIVAVLNRLFAKRIEHTLGDIRREELALQAYTSVFATLEELEPESDWLAEQHRQIDGAHGAVEQLCNYATSNAARGRALGIEL